MTLEQHTLLMALIRSALKGEVEPSVTERLSESALRELYTPAKTYDLVHFVGYVLDKLGRTSTPIEQEYVRMYMFAVYRYEQLRQDTERLCEVLEEQNISYLPLKGAALRHYYPAPWMRTSSDVDVLVPKEQLARAKEAVQDRLGYVFDQASDHDLAFLTPAGTHVELHFSLIEDGVVGKVDEPLRQVWQYAAPRVEGSYHYELDDDMFYYYHIAHMAKHYVQGGCGIRPFLDLWLMLQRQPQSRERREQLLKKGGILTFAQHAEQLAGVWFGKQEHTDVTAQMQKFLLAGGEFGTYANRAAVAQVKKGGKTRYALSRIWLTYREMCVFYPSLQGRRFLLPVYELWRWLRLLFGGGVKRSLEELSANEAVTQQQREETEHMLRRLGL